MNFKLKCLNNGKIEYWNYDNVRNRVTNPDGINPLQRYEVTGYKKVYGAYGEDTQYRINDRLVVLYISLGLKCNFHCKYCQQSDLPQDFIVQANPERCRKFIEVLKKANLKIDEEIIFWGGDPLVYWKNLKILIPEIRKLYPHIKMGMVTNGSILDDEKFDFFREYKVGVVISYDGKHTWRDYPVFDDPKVVEAVKKAHKMGNHIAVLPLITNISDFPWEIQKELDEKLGFRIPVAWHSIVKCNNDGACYRKYTIISDERMEILKKHFYDFFHRLPQEFDRGDLERFNETRKAIARAIPVDSERNSCASHIGNHLTLDMDGNVLACMNYPFKSYGNILDNTPEHPIVITDFYSHLRRKKCMACPFVCACFGICPLVKDENGDAFAINCRNYKVYAEAEMKGAIDSLYGIRVLEFLTEEEYEREKEKVGNS